jgi:hypothetical protein
LSKARRPHHSDDQDWHIYFLFFRRLLPQDATLAVSATRPAFCLLAFATLSTCAGLSSAQIQKPAPSPNPARLNATRPESRQLDFWIGDWDVTIDEKKKIGSSKIESIVGGYGILENYSQPDGYHGKSLNFFDSVLGKWRQTWVDSLGNMSEFVGEYKDGAMRLEGETHRKDGTKILRRMTLSKLEGDRVRQYSERSTDKGKTWSIAYDYIYLRRSASPAPAVP